MKKPPLIIWLTALSAVTWPVAGERTLLPIHSPTLNKATRNKVLLINEGTEPRSLDPQTAQSTPEYHIIRGLIEGLVSCHPTDQSKEVPGMADRWEHNNDYSIWTGHVTALRAISEISSGFFIDSQPVSRKHCRPLFVWRHQARQNIVIGSPDRSRLLQHCMCLLIAFKILARF